MGGYLGLDSDLGGEGTVVLDSIAGNAILEASGSIAAAQSIELEGSFDILDLHGTTPYDAYVDRDMAASITGFGGSDFIEIVSNGPLDGVHFADELTLSHDGTVVYSLHVVGDYASDAFQLSGPGNNEIYAISLAPCFGEGTRIETDRGEVAVDALREGDTVRLASGGAAPVVWIGHRRARDADRVRIRRNAFGEGLPRQELVLSPDHAVLANGHLIPIEHLVNDVSIVRERCATITYYHVELDLHGVVLAEGLPAESYLDTGNRSAFANCRLVAMTPAFEPGSVSAEPCAPMAFDGAIVEAVRARLASNLGTAADGCSARVA